MSEKMWQDAVAAVEPHIFKISSPQAQGTGFLVSNSAESGFCSIATAAHVVAYADWWEQPIRLVHAQSDATQMLHHNERVIILDNDKDTAVILFRNGNAAAFPEAPLGLVKEGMYIKIGNEIGWLGFPAVRPSNLCLFSGRISSWDQELTAYFVDGVAINGVSGGPAFLPFDGAPPVLVGLVAAYVPNRATGDTLPGLSIVRDVSKIHDALASIRSFEEAVEKAKKTPREQPPEARPEGEATGR